MIKNSKRKDGRVKSAVYIGDGKYKYVYAANNKELSQKVQELKIQLGKGIDITAELDTFGEWADRWLKLKKAEVSNGRYNTYTYRVRNLEPLRKVQIGKIRAADIQELILDLAAEGYAEKTLKDVKNTASQVFKLAISNRVIDFNPAEHIKIPTTAEQAEPRRALTEEEQQWILAPSENRGHHAAMIMMFAGLRRGELIPLLWSDIDLDNGTINVNKSVEMIDGKSVVKRGAKTEAGERIVYIPKVLVNYLSGVDRQNNLLVCPSSKGTMLTDSGWKRMWDSYLAELNFKFGNFDNIIVNDPKTGQPQKYQKTKSRFAPKKIPFVIPRITAHWLRHTFITMMYMVGVDLLTAKEQAGHADVQTTMEIYTHLDKIYKAKQISKLDEYLSKIG